MTDNPIKLTITHDRDGVTSFADIAFFVDQVRARYPKYADTVIRLERDDKMSDHEDVTFNATL